MFRLAFLAASMLAAYVAYAVRSPQAQRWGRGFHRGPPGNRQLALTFDDGPSEWTLGVLEVLERYGIAATFFLCGMNIERLPEVARLLHSRGHEIGNHTYSHPRLFLLSGRRIHDELAQTQRVIEQTIGISPRLFRPPYGCRAPGLLRAEQQLGLTEVLWTVIGNDWKWDATAISRQVLAGVDPGGIICLHDGDRVSPHADRSQTVAALKQLLPVLVDQGYSFVTAGAMQQDLSFQQVPR